MGVGRLTRRRPLHPTLRSKVRNQKGCIEETKLESTPALTLLGVLEPVDHLLHLLEEHCAALGAGRTAVPGKDRILRHHVRCTQ
jgi:hypothetical protein